MNLFRREEIPDETGEGIHLCGSLSVEDICMIRENPRGRVNLTIENEGYETDLVFSRGQILTLKRMIEEFLRTGISTPKEGERTEGWHGFHAELDLSEKGISAEVAPAREDDTAFAYLRLKGRQGSKAVIHLGLGLTQQISRQIKERLDAAAEEGRLA
jgi:hypothetical protein